MFSGKGRLQMHEIMLENNTWKELVACFEDFKLFICGQWSDRSGLYLLAFCVVSDTPLFVYIDAHITTIENINSLLMSVLCQTGLTSCGLLLYAAEKQKKDATSAEVQRLKASHESIITPVETVCWCSWNSFTQKQPFSDSDVVFHWLGVLDCGCG